MNTALVEPPENCVRSNHAFVRRNPDRDPSVVARTCVSKKQKQKKKKKKTV
jgi:hypothetical protein|tara:strand:- start:424 stop:576 length:153 start_codon:yes stop_codon:yes gene_type:complete